MTNTRQIAESTNDRIVADLHLEISHWSGRCGIIFLWTVKCGGGMNSLMNWLWNAQLIAPINLSACKQVVLDEQMNWYERTLWCNRPTDPVHLLYSNAREEYLNAKSIHSVSLMIIKALMGGRGCQLAIARSDSLHSHTDILVYYYK